MFCLHLKYYLEQDIVFTDGEAECPTGYLPGMGTEDVPDVHLLFNHDKVNEEARQKWEQRKRWMNPEKKKWDYISFLTNSYLKKNALLHG